MSQIKKKKRLSKEQKQQRLLERESIRLKRNLEDNKNLKQDVKKKYENNLKNLDFDKKLIAYQKVCNCKVFNAEICPKCDNSECHYAGRISHA